MLMDYDSIAWIKAKVEISFHYYILHNFVLEN